MVTADKNARRHVPKCVTGHCHGCVSHCISTHAVLGPSFSTHLWEVLPDTALSVCPSPPVLVCMLMGYLSLGQPLQAQGHSHVCLHSCPCAHWDVRLGVQCFMCYLCLDCVCHGCPELTFFPFRPGLPSSPGFPCRNRTSVRCHHSAEGRKGTEGSRTHRCSRGARGAREPVLSSEAWKPLEEVLARIERASQTSLQNTPWAGRTTPTTLHCRDPPQDWEIPFRFPEAQIHGLGDPLLRLPRDKPPKLGSFL